MTEGNLGLRVVNIPMQSCYLPIIIAYNDLHCSSIGNVSRVVIMIRELYTVQYRIVWTSGYQWIVLSGTVLYYIRMLYSTVSFIMIMHVKCQCHHTCMCVSVCTGTGTVICSQSYTYGQISSSHSQMVSDRYSTVLLLYWLYILHTVYVT